jgi:hypothetical protein
MGSQRQMSECNSSYQLSMPWTTAALESDLELDGCFHDGKYRQCKEVFSAASVLQTMLSSSLTRSS